MNKPLDLAGQVFGRLTALNRVGSIRSKSAWLCRCDCGVEVTKTSDDLRSGNVTSCGCLRREVSGQRWVTHGATNTPEYRTWSKMKERCHNSDLPGYENYGGRGITIDPRWDKSFEEFLKDMGPKPSPDHSIERDNTNGNYEPDNCRWATRTEQNRNRRNTVTFEHEGRQVTIGELSDLTGKSYRLLYKRLVLLGWSVTEAIRR